MNLLQSSTVGKGTFAGMFSRFPVEAESSGTFSKSELTRLKELWPLVLGFDATEKQTNYDWAISRPEKVEKWQTGVFGYSVASASNSLASIFAGLSKPDEYFDFANKYGALFGTRFSGAFNSKFESIDKNALYRLFNYPDGKKAESSSHKCLNCNLDLKPASYELLADWVNAVNLLRFSFALYDYLNNDFDIESTEACIFIGKGELKRAIALSDMGDGFYEIPLRLQPLNVSNSDHVINDESEYLALLNSALGEQFEKPSDFVTSCKPIRQNDLGYLHMIVDLGSLKRPEKAAIREALTKILEILISAHNVVMKTTVQNGKMTYTFDSLLACLWFQFSQVLVGAVDFRVCERCGKPFLPNNKGHKKKYCSPLCRVNAANKRRKKAKIDSA